MRFFKKFNSDTGRLFIFMILPNGSTMFQFRSIGWWGHSIVYEVLSDSHSSMACIRPKIEESILFLIQILTSKFLTGFYKTAKRAHHYETRNHALLYESIPNSNHSELGSCVYFSLAWWNHPNDKCRSRRTAFASITSVLHRIVQNLNEYVQECTTELILNLDEIDISNWYDRKPRKIGVEATIPGQMIHDTSGNISKCQVYFGDCLCLDQWKITHPLHNSVARFRLDLKAVQEARCWIRNRFGLEIESEAIYQRRDLVDYIRTVVLSNLAEIRALNEFTDEMTVLLMDN
jgi:hypothetical protein